jgi:FAD:protein FMN transferase
MTGNVVVPGLLGLPAPKARRFLCRRLGTGGGPKMRAFDLNGDKRGVLSMNPLTAFHFDFFAMGSPCGLTTYGRARGEAEAVAAAAIAEVRRIEQLYSRYQPVSLLSRINDVAKLGGAIEVDAETSDLIDHAFAAHSQSEGLFDVTSGLLRELWNDEIERLPSEAAIKSLLDLIGLHKLSWRRPRLSFPVAGMELDFGGIAKEYAADRAAKVCRLAEANHGLVNLGGDIAIVGPHPDGAPWRIGIRDPAGGQEPVATLFVPDGGVATSGDYERYFEVGGRRYSHALNPKTGWPVDGSASITVAASDCLSAGSMATIAVLMGEAGPRWLGAVGAAHLYVKPDGQLAGSIIS